MAKIGCDIRDEDGWMYIIDTSISKPFKIYLNTLSNHPYKSQHKYSIYLVEFCKLLQDANHTFGYSLEIARKYLNHSNTQQRLLHLSQ